MSKAINVKIDDSLWKEMKRYDEVNWSGVIRTSLKKKIETLESETGQSSQAVILADKVRQSTDTTKMSSGKILRAWREKRK